MLGIDYPDSDNMAHMARNTGPGGGNPRSNNMYLSANYDETFRGTAGDNPRSNNMYLRANYAENFRGTGGNPRSNNMYLKGRPGDTGGQMVENDYDVVIPTSSRHPPPEIGGTTSYPGGDYRKRRSAVEEAINRDDEQVHGQPMFNNIWVVILVILITILVTTRIFKIHIK